MPGPVAVEQDFADRVAAACGAGHRAVSVDVMPGGHSGLTHRVEVEGPDGKEALVVKSTPPGREARGRHDVLRQARIVEALGRHGGVPVPRIRCSDASPPPFFATDLIPGVAIDPVIDQERTPIAEADVAARWDAAIDVVAELHAAPLADLGLEGEPVRSPDEELAIWEATIRAGGMEDDPRVIRLRQAMRRAIPAAGAASVVHGDFRLGNILFEGRTPRALIDWEIWSIGDPAVDLGWFIQFTDPDNYPGVGHDVPGTPTADEVLQRYAGRRGEHRPELGWFLALGCFKLAAIQAHNRHRHLQGRYEDPWQELLGPSIARLLERGLEHLGA